MPRLNCDESLNIMTEVRVNFIIDFQTEHSRRLVHVYIEGKFERNYREKRTNERDISNAVDSHFH